MRVLRWLLVPLVVVPLVLLLLGGAGLVYLAVSLALRIPELTTIVRLMSDALPRPGRP